MRQIGAEKEGRQARRRDAYSVRIQYSKAVDAFCILLSDVPVADGRAVEDGVTLDFDTNGHIVGLEVLDASQRLGLSNLVNVSIENLPVERVPSAAA